MEDITGGIRLENHEISVVVYPERGGKTGSVFSKRKQAEVLYQPRDGYGPLTAGMRFSDADASGFDDVFPSMGETWTDPASGRKMELPDHGEIWTARMAVDAAGRDSVHMHTEGRCFPYLYEKEIRILENRVRERITVTNRGTEAFPGMWVCHCLMRMEEGMRLRFPEGSERLDYIRCCEWPEKIPETIREWEMPPAGAMMKFYFREPVRAGECSVVYPRSGVEAVMRFRPEQLPYFGLWMTNGGYRGEANFAFEPANGYYDTLGKAAESGTLPMIGAGEKREYEVEIELK